MATISTLPNEVAELILWEIDDLRALSSISSICRWFHSLSFRPLYNSYTNPAKEGPSGLVDHQNLQRFARTILEKPNSWCLVKNVRLGWRQDRLAEKLLPGDIQPFLRAGKALEFDDDDQDIPFRLRWKQAIANSRADATVCLLLANLPGLKQLDMILDQVENCQSEDQE